MLKPVTFLSMMCFILAACTSLPRAILTATERPIEPTTAPTVEPKSNLSAEAAIYYRRSGGIAGLDESWTIYPDGRVTRTLHPQGEKSVTERQVSPNDVRALIRQLVDLRFFELTESNIPINTCCDRITYDIEARSGNQVNHIITVDGATDVPAEAWQVIEALNAFISQFE